ncbi:torsin family 4, member Ab isoform X1 [Pygocentrus nattereri]|uniref:torsin family 4, member Ab isoform X1 n=2 Tax=Pygocentrus nattereri TaxID=42514 RepID=UPI0008142E15|nr:torsin family 4, member Ab isoform X1 [Pygocentrus nattereri]
MGGIGGGEKEGGSRHFSELLKMDRTDDEMEPCVKANRVGRESGLENVSSGSSSALPLQLKAMVRIRSKYLRRMRPEHGASPSSPEPTTATRPERSASPHRRKGRRRMSRVMFPSDRKKYLPKNRDRSRVKLFLFLFFIVVFLQVYNAIENLDDHVEKYDLDGLERALYREVFGQQETLETLMYHLNDYLSTYAHQRPLVLSMHGASGVGKSHLGRLLARHFRSVVGNDLVVQYFTLHHCPLQESPENCTSKLIRRVTKVVTQAEEEERIPLFVLDEVELMRPPLLDMLRTLMQPKQTNEFLNVVYVLLSSLGEEEITAYYLQNASASGAEQLLRQTLGKLHPLWEEPGVEIIPLTLLERSHVVQCFLEEMTDEGFYPDPANVERLAGELAYHRAGGKEYAKTGCKQVVAKVNLL